jgi:hypothetical protein
LNSTASSVKGKEKKVNLLFFFPAEEEKIDKKVGTQ